MNNNIITPDWPLPDNVRCIQTTRQHGFSLPPFNSFNLAMHVGDHAEHVHANRTILSSAIGQHPHWLNQIHSNRIIEYSEAFNHSHADGIFSTQSNQACAVLTADCMPILFSYRDGIAVAAVHAGWRGLAAGIIDNTVSALVHQTGQPADQLLVWLGPAISRNHFEVGEEVKQVFEQKDAAYAQAFINTHLPSQYFADLYQIATFNLQQLGINNIYGGNFCTYHDKEHFYSYRRDGTTGRMASVIWKLRT